MYAAAPLGGYTAGQTLDPDCAPGDTDCVVAITNGGGSGWSLTGNTGTTAGTNFIGTTDTEDFMIKTNGNQVALFGQNGNVAIGSGNIGFGLVAPVATGIHSFATGLQTTASGIASAAFGVQNVASGNLSTAFGDENIVSGNTATSFGNGNTASGQLSFTSGTGNIASGYGSIALGRDLLSRN